MNARVRSKELGGVDTDVRVPAAVKAGAARADAAFKAAYGNEDKLPPATGGDDLVKLADPKTEPVNKVTVEDFTPPPANDQTPKPQQVQPAPNPQMQPKQPQNGDVGGFEQKYLSAQGRLQTAERFISQQNNRISMLEGTVFELQQQISQRRTPEPTPAPTTKNYVTPEMREAFGEDNISFAQAAAREVMEPYVEKLQHEIDETKRDREDRQKREWQMARNHLLNTMHETFPNGAFDQINHADDFAAWLNLPDAYSGVMRRTLLNQAYDANDTPRVLNFFNGFLAERAATTPSIVPPPPPNTGRVPMENFAAPGRAKSEAASAAPPEKPVIKTSQISQFYRDVNAGKYANNPSGQAKLERMIFDAQLEGRIERDT